MKRRDMLRLAGHVVLKGALVGGAYAALGQHVASATAPAPAHPRRLALVNTHTGDAFNEVYWEAGSYVPDALRSINHVLRDHRSGETHAIDPHLLDQLSDLRARVNANAPYQVISGYRSPASNAALHANSSGVASHSLHMEGRAIDIRMAGVALPQLRNAAVGMGRGGVGFYEDSDFIHLDTGRVRRW